ncbi:MAG: hypothetical protein ACLQFR_08410 [Streptosporangiaceae bacterium]
MPPGWGGSAFGRARLRVAAAIEVVLAIAGKDGLPELSIPADAGQVA